MPLPDGNPFHEIHYANNLLLEFVLMLDQKPWDAAAAEKIAKRLRDVGYKLDMEPEEAARRLADLERGARVPGNPRRG